MKTLKIEDTHKLHQSIEQLYTLHNLDTFGVDVLSIVDRLISSEIPRVHFTTKISLDEIVFLLPNNYSASLYKLPQADATVTGFSLHQTWVNFTERDRLAFNLLRPHLAQAYSNARKYHKLQETLSQLQQSLAEKTLPSLNSLKLLELSQRETEVLTLVIQGKNNKAIAAQMNVGISTVRKHLENIYQKLDVQSRTEAIAHALERLGFLPSLPLS
jgi:DNA-binding CsgD family transcriptional regulator